MKFTSSVSPRRTNSSITCPIANETVHVILPAKGDPMDGLLPIGNYGDGVSEADFETYLTRIETLEAQLTKGEGEFPQWLREYLRSTFRLRADLKQITWNEILSVTSDVVRSFEEKDKETCDKEISNLNTIVNWLAASGSRNLRPRFRRRGKGDPWQLRWDRTSPLKRKGDARSGEDSAISADTQGVKAPLYWVPDEHRWIFDLLEDHEDDEEELEDDEGEDGKFWPDVLTLHTASRPLSLLKLLVRALLVGILVVLTVALFVAMFAGWDLGRLVRLFSE